MSEVVEEFLELKRNSNLAYATTEALTNAGKHVKRLIGDKFIQDIKWKDVQEALNAMATKEDGTLYSKRSIAGVKKLMNSVFNYAVDNDYIVKSPMSSNIKAPAGTPTKSKEKFLTPKQLEKVLSVVKGNIHYLTMVKLQLMTGLRIGELIALHIDDIDRKRKVLHVTKAIKKVGYVGEDGNRHTRYEVGDTKTENSIRDIDIKESTIDMLDKYRAYLQGDKNLMERVKKNGTGHLLFPNDQGRLRSYQTTQNHFKNYLKRNGIGHLNVTFHMFRHCFASYMLENGVDLTTVSRMLGHTDIETTANIYVTVTHKSKREAVNKLWTSALFDLLGKYDTASIASNETMEE